MQKKYSLASLVCWVLLASILGGCSVLSANPEPARTRPAEATATLPASPPAASPTPAPSSTPTVESHSNGIAATGENQHVEGELYQDDFTDPESGWSKSLAFDNYFIGYHEPTYYHVEVHAPNDRALAALPKQTFTDFTLESKVFTEPNNTAPEGGFRYGLIFRRTGGQYYAFTISPRDKTWQLLKVAPSGTQELKSGEQASIQGLQASDTLRVDVKGTAFYLWINDKMIAQASDADYSSGEVGFLVETLDIPRVHIHYDTITVREVELPSATRGLIYQESFTDPKSGWPESVAFDNSFIGYHEPTYYHVEVHAPNDRTVAALPEQTFTDLTLESKVFTEPNNTAPEGGFRYGLIFRRSGGQYYAFTISPRDMTWQLLKVTPNGTEELEKGRQDSIRGLKGSDTLRVDAAGSEFYLWINERLVAQASDDDYANGEVGFYVETFDNPRVHIHYDTITIREVDVPKESCEIIINGLNVRNGPDTNEPVFHVARYQDKFEPLARSQDSQWLEVRIASTLQVGWVRNLEEYFSCTVPVDDLPIKLR